MSSHGRSHRSRSRADAFLDALESGQVREAIGTLKPSSQSHDGHRHRHHDTRVYEYYDERPSRRSRHDDYYPPEDGYYYDEGTRPRRHRSAHSDKYDDRRGRSSGHHSHGHSHHRRSSSSHGAGPALKQAAGAAVAAGVIEAFRSRHDADRNMRVATAAIGAAATDSALGGGRHDHKETRHIVESTLAGLAGNRVINGPRQ
ncbi:hypothetical protein F4680DRAFT_152736 [Xylaria scruposa]|nr:hypothetical protein F4680DRAFT_152736 [Xylaria scruposa]